MRRRLIDNGTTNNLTYAFCEASSSFHGVEPVTATNVQRGPIQHSIVCRDDDWGARHGDTGTASIPASYSHCGKPFVAWLDGARARAMGPMETRALPSPLLAGRVRGFPGASLPRRPLANDVEPAESRAPWRRYFRWRRTPGPGRETASRPDRGGQGLWQQCHRHRKIGPDRGVKRCIAVTGGILWAVRLRLDGWGEGRVVRRGGSPGLVARGLSGLSLEV